jgi:hypothetical protein
VRCRPLSHSELAAGGGSAVAVPSRGALCLTMEGGKPAPGGGDNRPTSHECAFDAVLGPDCSGRQVLVGVVVVVVGVVVVVVGPENARDGRY